MKYVVTDGIVSQAVRYMTQRHKISSICKETQDLAQKMTQEMANRFELEMKGKKRSEFKSVSNAIRDRYLFWATEESLKTKKEVTHIARELTVRIFFVAIRRIRVNPVEVATEDMSWFDRLKALCVSESQNDPRKDFILVGESQD